MRLTALDAAIQPFKLAGAALGGLRSTARARRRVFGIAAAGEYEKKLKKFRWRQAPITAQLVVGGAVRGGA